MSSPPSVTRDVARPRWHQSLRAILQSRWTFAGLQILDLLTTLAAFHFGGYEANPLVAELTEHLGRFRGVVASKLIAIFIALGVRRLVWVVNLFYTGIVVWNLVVLLALSARPK
jgi:hypothetical protein